MPAAPGADGRTLVVGEAVADVVRPLHGPGATHPGGSPANVAYGLAVLGRPVTLLTELGDDEHGDLLRRHLSRAGVEVLVAPGAGRTASAVARLGPDGAATYEFAISWSLAHGAPPVPAAHVHTGSIAAFMPPGADAVPALLAAARATGTTSLDPNIRPGLLGDHADAVRRLAGLAAAADVIKASDEDLAWLYPGADPLDAARRWVDGGTGLVVVTRGARGALAVTAAEHWEVPPVRVPVADTVGAGDAFMAALLHGLHGAGLLGPGGRAVLGAAPAGVLAGVLTTAAVAAAITVSRPGADPPTLDELTAWVPAGS
jgi:fructokinase